MDKYSKKSVFIKKIFDVLILMISFFLIDMLKEHMGIYKAILLSSIIFIILYSIDWILFILFQNKNSN